MTTHAQIVDEPLTQAREEIEREAMIEALIADDMRAIDKGSDLITQVLLWGFDGYENVNTYDLRDEMKTRGLEL